MLMFKMRRFLHNTVPYWMIFLPFLIITNVLSVKPLEPIYVLHYEQNNVQKYTLSYTDQEPKSSSLIAFCPVKELDKEDYIVDSPVDKRIVDLALHVQNTSKTAYVFRTLRLMSKLECHYPLRIVREKNMEVWPLIEDNEISEKGEEHETEFFKEEALVDEKKAASNKEVPNETDGNSENKEEFVDNTYYSVYGLYVTYGAYGSSVTVEEDETLKNSFIAMAQKYTDPMDGSPRSVNGEVFMFMQLYKSIDNVNHEALYYRYMISKAVVKRFEGLYKNIIESTVEDYINAFDDTCYGVKLDHVFRDDFKEAFTEKFLSETKDNIKEEGFKMFDDNFRIAYLVPKMHILFDGFKSLEGNCSIISTWESTYNYLFQVDKALIAYVKGKNEDAYITVGYTMNEFKAGIVLPELIWKRVIMYKGEEVDYEKSFVVTISNKMNQSGKLEKSSTPCKRSCSEVHFYVQSRDDWDLSSEKENVEKDEEADNAKKLVNDDSEMVEEMVEEEEVENDKGILNCCRLQDEEWKEFTQIYDLNEHPIK